MTQDLSMPRAGALASSVVLDSSWAVAPPPGAGGRLRDLGRGLLRRARLVVLVVVVLNVAAILAVGRLTPRYTAEALLMVGPREEQVMDLKAVLSGLGGDSDVIESEIQVVRSRGIIRGIIERAHLDRLPEFNASLRPPGVREQAGAFVSEQWNAVLASPALAFLHLAPRPAQPPRPSALTPVPPGQAGELVGPPPDPLSGEIDTFLQHLDVASKGHSRVIGVSFTSASPALAAGLANAVSDSYIASQLKAKTDATAQAHQWLDGRVAELRQQMLDADNAAAEYRRSHGLVRGRETSLLTEQISELGTEVMRAGEAVAVARGRLAAVGGINPNALGLRQGVAAAEAQERRLSANLDALRQQSSVGTESEIELRALQQEADADRALYDRLLARAKETQIQSGLQQPDAKLVSRAERPPEPSFPRPALILPAVFVASVLFAVLLVLMLEGMDGGFSTAAELEAALGLPAIGAVPMLRRREARRRPPERLILDSPHCAFSEAIRSLHTSLMLRGVGGTPKVVLVASALPGEGKTALALSLARMMASCGRRVALVDCDLRRPGLHKAFRCPRGPGLVELLSGGATLGEVLRADPLSPASLVPAGRAGNTAPDLFASPAMSALLDTLSQEYDLVVLDSAPVLAVSDGRHLCRLADQTVFVVRWRDTRCETVAEALRQTVSPGGRIAGLVLSMVGSERHLRLVPTLAPGRRPGLYLEG